MSARIQRLVTPVLAGLVLLLTTSCSEKRLTLAEYGDVTEANRVLSHLRGAGCMTACTEPNTEGSETRWSVTVPEPMMGLAYEVLQQIGRREKLDAADLEASGYRSSTSLNALKAHRANIAGLRADLLRLPGVVEASISVGEPVAQPAGRLPIHGQQTSEPTTPEMACVTIHHRGAQERLAIKEDEIPNMVRSVFSSTKAMQVHTYFHQEPDLSLEDVRSLAPTPSTNPLFFWAAAAFAGTSILLFGLWVQSRVQLKKLRGA